MSVQSEIDRINGEVNSQSTIIDQISSVLDSKSPSNMLSSGAIVTNSVSTPLQNNTTKLQALKEKADSLPEYVPPAKLQEKTVTPSAVQQEVTPDSGYDGLSKVTVEAVSNVAHITQIECYPIGEQPTTRIADPNTYILDIFVNDTRVFSKDGIGGYDGYSFSVDFTIDFQKDYLGFGVSRSNLQGDTVAYYIEGNTMYIRFWQQSY